MVSQTNPVFHPKGITTSSRCTGRVLHEGSRTWPVLALLLPLAGCAGSPLQTAGSLRSYDRLEQSDGLLTRSKVYIAREDVLRAKTVRIIPTTFSTSTASFNNEQRRLVANAVDRTLCNGLSERFEIISQGIPTDLTVHAVITHAEPTEPISAGISKGASVVKSVLLPGVPVPIPRIPIGLGSLSLEAEARDGQDKQQAAIIWARGANAFFDPGRVAEEGDAYTLAAAFGDDFSKLLVKAETPFGKFPSLPSYDQLSFAFGGAPKAEGCKAFGNSPGLIGMIGAGIGAPPEWTDKGTGAGL